MQCRKTFSLQLCCHGWLTNNFDITVLGVEWSTLADLTCLIRLNFHQRLGWNQKTQTDLWTMENLAPGPSEVQRYFSPAIVISTFLTSFYCLAMCSSVSTQIDKVIEFYWTMWKLIYKFYCSPSLPTFTVQRPSIVVNNNWEQFLAMVNVEVAVFHWQVFFPNCFH